MPLSWITWEDYQAYVGCARITTIPLGQQIIDALDGEGGIDTVYVEMGGPRP